MVDTLALRRLIVGCPAGLANRLRVLTSGLAWQRLTGVQFTMWWPQTAPCSAAFTRLFEPVPEVGGAMEAEVMALPAVGSYLFTPMFDIAAATEPELAFRCSGWLVPPRLPLLATAAGRLLPKAPAPFTDMHAKVMAQAAIELGRLRPVETIRLRVEQFATERFRRQMIGVHVRRGDFPAQRPDATPDLKALIRAIQTFLKSMPDAAIFVATDDGAVNPYTGKATGQEGVVERLRAEFGDRIVTAEPSTLDRRDPKAIEDALVDLLLLRRTQAVVGSAASSFSELAVFGRSVPVVYCAGADRMKWFWRLTLVEPLVVLWGVLRFGRVAPFPVLVAHYREQWAKRQAK